MKIVTWNINSVRARRERLLAWLERHAPDVVCLQELKAEDALFPLEEVQRMGYFAALHGQKTYNGVAILSKTEPVDVARGWSHNGGDPQARLIEATVGGVRILSVYVPNGASVGTDKWDYKLDWLARLQVHLANRYEPRDPVLVCGDFNVAPEDRDVARPEVWRESVLCHPEARRALADIVAWGLDDTIRRHHDGPGPFSWWDYRNLGFPKNDGLRIDHIFATPVLFDRCTAAYVDRDERKGQKPSDHAPVVAEFDAV